jgi:anti-sigma regulatory factor (Ser/Thr protein kinase)
MTETTYRTGSFRHELVLHDGPAELVDLMVPFAREGAAVGEHVVVLGEPDFVHTLQSAVPEVSLRVVAERRHQRFPGRDLHRAQQALARLDPAGRAVRIINQMPAMTAREWLGWRRYEAAANIALAPYRAWGKCAHDERTLDPRMLAELRATHPYLETRVGGGENPDFDRLGIHTRRFLDVPRHPVEDAEPALSMLEPTPATARRTVRDLAVRSGLSPTGQECVILATSEAVTNAWIHGRPPVLLRAWTQPGGVTIAVSDNGAGPDPLVGMLAAPSDRSSGRGMWMLHLLLSDIYHRRDQGGYTITFTVDRDTEAHIA